MESIKRLVLAVIPNQVCNLKCEYCYISQADDWEDIGNMQYSPEHIARCLSKKRLGGTCLINLTGNGETLLQKEIVEIAHLLLKEGHYVEIVTNGTISKRITELLELPKEEVSRLFFKVSFHYKELRRLGLLTVFFENILKIKNSNASFTLELMAYDEIENDIADIREICLKNVGAVCQATVGRDDTKKNRGLLSRHERETYQKIWGKLNSPLLDFKLKMIGEKRKEFCYAGAWSLFVNLYTGESQPCYRQPYNQNLFKYPEKPIKFLPVGHYCMLPYCVNAHAHMAWGDIEIFNKPLYCEMRNRVCDNGEEWLKESCKMFFSSKLYDSNFKYGVFRRTLHTVFFPFVLFVWSFRRPLENIKRIRKFINNKSHRG